MNEAILVINITIKSVPGTNQYWAMYVNVLLKPVVEKNHAGQSSLTITQTGSPLRHPTPEQNNA